MKQAAFEEKYGRRWDDLERLLVVLERGAKPNESERAELEGFPQLYREVCRDLSLATQRAYGPRLLSRLNQLVLAGHRQLYRRTTEFAATFLRFAVHGFPERLRRDAIPFAIASALFVLPGLALFGAVMVEPEMIYSAMPGESVADFEAMYDPSSARFGTNRSAASDIQMFGFYIMNNIGISFQCFATGIVFGSIVHLIYNSLVLGGLSAHAIHLGYQETFYSFVIGHGAFKLTAIAISGAAGLKLGYALVAPGRRSRVDSLRNAAGESLQLMYGVMAMLALAAVVEAFWSSKVTIPAEIKYVVGSAFWALVIVYIALAGRVRGS